MAILTKAQLEALNQSSFPDQSTEAITPAILRNYNTQTIDTLVDSLDTGSFTTDAEFNAFTSSTNSSITQLNASSASQQTQINSLIAATSSYATSAITASSLITASFSGNTLTFTKGDSSTFGVVIPDVSGSSVPAGTVSGSAQIVALGFLQTSSFNSYTSSTNSSISQLNASSASQQISINALNSYTASNQPISTASFATTGSNTFVGGQRISGSNDNHLYINRPGGTDVLRLGVSDNGNTFDFRMTGSSNQDIWLIDNQGGTFGNVFFGFLQSEGNTVLNNLTASLQQGYVWVGNASGKTSLVATSSFAGGGSIPAGTVSSSAQIVGYNIFATTGSNTFVGNQTISSSLFISGNINMVNGADLVTHHVKAAGSNGLELQNASSGIIVSMGAGGGTQASFTGAVTANSISASTINGLGNPLAFSQSVDARINAITASGGIPTGTVSSSAQILDYGIFATTGSNLFRGTQDFETSANSATIRLYQGNVVDGTQSNSIQFREGSSQNPSSSYYNIQVTPGDSAFLAFTEQPSNVKFIQMIYSSSISSRSLAIDVPITTATGNPVSIFKDTEITGALNISSTFTASLAEGFTYVGNASGKTTLVATSSFGGGGTGFATTGSNTFTGDQTLTDAAGNFFTITDTSGSMMLVAKSFTSASAHLTSSVNQVNLIIKSNNNTGDTVLSGSNNVIGNPATPTTGFRRYYTNANISLQGGAPQISASMGFSPTISGNNILSNANPITIRGPVSSSAYTIQQNVIAGGTVNLGSAAATNFEKASNGFNMSANIINGTVQVTAYKTNFISSSAMAISSNNIGGGVALNADSSSITLAGATIQNSSFTVNNSYYNASATGGGNSLQITQGNAIFGINTLLYASGSNTTAGTGRQFNANISAGTFNSASLNLNGDNSNMVATAIIGHNLGVTGSAALQTGAPIRSNTYGSAFFGRFNAQDGTKALTAETVFAIGTGTTSAPKTGFLIDSGSNTFVEGTLNVSGASSLNGALNVNGATALTGAVGIDGDVNLTYTSDITTKGGIYFNGSPFDSGVPIDNLAQWVITPGGTQFSQGWTSNSSANSYGVKVLYNNDSSSLQSSVQLSALQSGSDAYVKIQNNSGSRSIELNAQTIQLSGSIQLPFGTDKPAGTVSLSTDSGGEATLTNSLIQSNSVILLTAKGDYRLWISSQSAGSAIIDSSVSSTTITFNYLVINPI